MIGSTLSHYEITSELGRGGMGIVYLAEDTKLGRKVAIKVLPSSALASDDDRARFYREAKAAAALNHPHIAQIYQIDEAVPSDAPHGTQPSPFIAMEYIDGEPLEAHIKRGPLKLGEAVRLAAQIAGALAAAHEKGIVHRDVKASNVMLTSKGDAKVLDFGLALTAASTKLTRMGSTLGTVAYMSPEQARGEEVDRRTDLWALGVVLYEMVAGRNPFGGDYEQAVVYSILNAEPEPLTAVRTGVPMEVEAITGKLLRKDRETRYQTAADLIADLKAIDVSGVRSGSYSGVTTGTVHGSEAPPAAQTGRNIGLPALLTIVGATAVLALLLGWILFSDSSPQDAGATTDIVRSTLVLPEDAPFSPLGFLSVERDAIDIDEDGRRLAFVSFDGATRTIALYSLAEGAGELLPGTDGGTNPVFSPDGRSIAYFVGESLFIVDVSGGRPRFIASVSEPTGMGWLNDGYLYIADGQGQRLRRIGSDGSSELIIPSGCNCAQPTDPPFGDGVVVSGRTSEDVVHILTSGERDTLNIRGDHVQFLPSGYVVFLRTGSMFAARFDPETGRIAGDGALVLDNVRTGAISGSGHYAISDKGTLIYAAGPPAGLLTPIMRMPDGSEERLSLPDGVYGEMDLSPDERRLIVFSFDLGRSLLLHDLSSGSTRALPVPEDVLYIVWDSDRTFMYAEIGPERSTFVRSGLSGGEEVLFSIEGRAFPSAVSDDGRYLAYRVTNSAGGSNIRIHDFEADSSIALVGTDDDPSTYWSPDFSPDGRHIAYTRSGDGRSEVFVRPNPPDGTVIGVSSGGGEEGVWVPDEERLVYRYEANWYAVDVNRTGDEISFSEPTVLFSGPYANVAGMEYRVLTEGRALLYRPVNTELNTVRIDVIAGFDRMLDELLPE